MPQQRRGVAVVAGGSAGLGRATVAGLAADGWDVGVLARGQAGLDGAVADVEAAGRRGLSVRTDVTDGEAVRAAADLIEQQLGPIDVWVNCAFVDKARLFWDLEPAQFDRLMGVSFGGQVNGLRTALAVMRPRDRGIVVNVSSSLAHRGIPMQSAYSASKHAVKGLTEAVSTELSATGSSVRVGLVTLPALNTPQFDWSSEAGEPHPRPVPPIYQPEVAARAIVEMARHPRRDVWVGLPTVATVVGSRVVPGFLDWFLGRYGIAAQQDDRTLRRTPTSNAERPQDGREDRGSHGPFDARARNGDVVSLLSRTVGRSVGASVGFGLRVVGSALDRLP